MKPASFTYHAPSTIDQALDMLARFSPLDGRVLAGGQSLVPAMAMRVALPQHLVDINGIAELARISPSKEELSIGACVRHAAFHRPVVEGPLGKLLTSVVRHIAHYPVRTRGTFCGSLANADPASEWCLVAATLDARMVARSVRGARTIAAADFFHGVMSTALAADELLVEVRLPQLASDTRCGFYEFNRRAGDFALAMSAAAFRIEGGVISEPRVGVGGVEAHPSRVSAAEEKLRGRPPGAETFAAAAAAAAAAVEPIEESPDAAAYKRDLVQAVVRRALESAERSA